MKHLDHPPILNRFTWCLCLTFLHSVPKTYDHRHTAIAQHPLLGRPCLRKLTPIWDFLRVSIQTFYFDVQVISSLQWHLFQYPMRWMALGWDEWTASRHILQKSLTSVICHINWGDQRTQWCRCYSHHNKNWLCPWPLQA